MSDSMISSSASRGCRGKEAGEDLQALMAQVRKLRVRSFILGGFYFFFFFVVMLEDAGGDWD